MCRRAVDGDDARAFLGADGVGGKALAVADVVDLDLFILADAGEVEQLAVDCAGAFILQLCVGNAGAVQLGFEQGQVHGANSEKQRERGIMRLVALRFNAGSPAVAAKTDDLKIDRQVIDETRFTQARRGQQDQLPLAGRRRRQIGGATQAEVVRLKARLAQQLLAGLLQSAKVGFARLESRRQRLQNARQFRLARFAVELRLVRDPRQPEQQQFFCLYRTARIQRLGRAVEYCADAHH